MRTDWTYVFALGLSLALAAGCSSSGKMRTARDASYTGRLERVLVVYPGKAREKYADTTAMLGRDFPQRVAERLADSLSRQNVPSAAAGLDESAVDRAAAVKADAARFGPKQLLQVTVAQISGRSSVQWVGPNQLPHYTHDVVITLEFEVSDRASDKTVWRGAMNFYAAPRLETVVDHVLTELHKASLL